MSADIERIDESVLPAAKIVALSGEYDLSRMDDLRTQLLGGPLAERVVADMSGVTFIDSSALRVFVEARTALESSGCRIVVRNLQPAPLRVFQLTGLAGIFGLE